MKQRATLLQGTLDLLILKALSAGALHGLGVSRRIEQITGGTFAGPEIRGEVMPGGWDWQLRRADGCTEVKADYFLKTDDGVVINVVNTGAICPGQNGERAPVRTHPVFEAPRGKYDWLSQNAFVGTLELAPPENGPAVKIRFFRVR